MKEYDVKITETLEKTVTVEAKSRADAEEQVRSAYYNSDTFWTPRTLPASSLALRRNVKFSRNRLRQ